MLKSIEILKFVFEMITGLGTLYILLLTNRLTKNIARLTKESDVLMECHRRYDQLLSDVRYIQAAPEKSVFYSRFWHLQQNQYEFWILNLIPDYEFKEWLTVRRLSFHSDLFMGEQNQLPYKIGWYEYGKKSSNNGFVQLFTQVHETSDDVEKLMYEARTRHDHSITTHIKKRHREKL